MSGRKVRTAILISGRGSNMIALAEAAAEKDYPAEIVGVISNRLDALGLTRAQEMGIQTQSIDHKAFKTRRDFEEELHRVLINMKAELICCAGFMRILSPWFVEQWPKQILNIHPSLLPKYKGLNTHQRAIDAGDAEAGCTVHWVTEELDGGDTILQKAIPIESMDTAETLAERLLPIELSLYPKALAKASKI